MTSLFSHSLLNDTDRDVRGAYKVFSHGTEHAAVANMAINDRSSADVSQLREDYAVVAKEMAKTQSLAASFLNISHYLSLIEKARNTIQGVEAKLTELDDTISEAARLIDSDDYKLVPLGAISGPELMAMPAVLAHLLLFHQSPQMEMGRGRHLQFKLTDPAIMKS